MGRLGEPAGVVWSLVPVLADRLVEGGHAGLVEEGRAGLAVGDRVGLAEEVHAGPGEGGGQLRLHRMPVGHPAIVAVEPVVVVPAVGDIVAVDGAVCTVVEVAVVVVDMVAFADELALRQLQRVGN